MAQEIDKKRGLNSRPAPRDRLHAERYLMAGKSSHGTFRNRYREGSLGGPSFRIMVAIIGLVVLLSLIVMALVLRGLREEIVVLRAMVEGAKQSVVVPERGRLIGLEERLEALEGAVREAELTGDPEPSKKEIQFRNAALRTLAKLLHRYEAGSSEIAELVGDFPEAEREKLIGYLASETPEVPIQDAGIAEEELKKAPSPVVESDYIPIQAHGSEPVSEESPYSSPGPPNLLKTRSHTVQPGETLSGIAGFYGMTVEKIMEANGIDNPDRIRVGRVLEIPFTE